MKTHKILFRAIIIFLYFGQCAVLHSQQSEIYTDSAVTYFYLTPTDSSATNKTDWFKDQRALIQSEISYQWGNDLLWIGNERNDYNYDLNDSIVECIGYRWNTGEDIWDYYSRDVNDFDENGNKVSFYRYNWIADSGKWVLYHEWIYNYDISGNSLGYEHSQRDIYSLEWVHSSKYVVQYNPDNKPISKTWYNWDQATNDWKYYVRQELSYSLDRLDSVFVSYWNTDDELWEVNDKEEYSYDSSGNIIQILGLGWNSTEEQWVNGIKDEYTCDSSGNVLQHLRSMWISATGDWQEWTKEMNQYESRGNLVSTEEYTWDFSNNYWTGTSKKTFEFDQNNHLIEEKTYQWVFGETTGTFMEDRKITFTYDMNGSLSIYARLNYFADRDVYEAWEKTFYTNNGIYQNDPEEVLSEIAIVLYPVPVRNTFMIKSDVELQRIEIFDLNGKMVKISRDKSVDISSLRSGIYLVNIFNNEGIRIFVQTIVKE